jgi:hypothetical protein
VLRITIKRRPLKVLDLDIENRPLSYLGSDFTTSEVTAIACSFIGEEKVYVWMLGHHTPREIMENFLPFYNEADMITGHYIRKHDLPILSGACLELGLPVLTPKLVQDTYSDLIKHKGISASQENLSAMYGLEHKKAHMNTTQWRSANRLEADGIMEAKKRVTDDVLQHKALREKLAGSLKPPRMWSP